MDIKKIRKNVILALMKFNMVNRFYDEIDDICHEIVLNRLEGRSQHQLVKHSVLDYLIKQKLTCHYSQRENLERPKIYRCGENIDKYGYRENGITDTVDKSVLINLAKQKLNRSEFKMFELIMSGLNQKYAGKKLGFQESRTSQIVSEIKRKMRKAVRSRY